MTNRLLLSGLLAAAMLPAATISANAQSGGAVRDEVMRHFNESMSKVIALAAAMPAEKYTWKPSDPAMPVGHVYAHIARYNFWYLTNEMKLPAAPGSIYGRPAPTWAVLVQLVAHMNEHLGQSIAYARSNNITPPWSQ